MRGENIRLKNWHEEFCQWQERMLDIQERWEEEQERKIWFNTN